MVQILAYIGQVAYMLSNREGGNLVNKPGGQFVQNLSCREATEFYGLGHILEITFHFNSVIFCKLVEVCNAG